MPPRVTPCEVNVYKSDLSSGLIDSTPLAYLYTARVYTQGALGGRCLVHCSAKWASHAGSAQAVCEKMWLQAHPIVHRRSVHARCAGVEDESQGIGARDGDEGRGVEDEGQGIGTRDGVKGSSQPQAHKPPGALTPPHPTPPHLTLISPSPHPHLTLLTPGHPPHLTPPAPPETRKPGVGAGRGGSGIRGSNSRPSAWEANALPTELIPRGKTKVRIVSEKTKGMRPDVKI